MIILAVDTTTDRLSVAAGSPGGPAATRFVEGARRHAGMLVSLAEQVLADVGAAMDRVEALALSDGPGSFTGLRVAAAWAKGIARVRAVPVHVASTLLVRAMAAYGTAEWVMGIGSALRGELFAAGYRFGSGGTIGTAFPPTVLAPRSAPPESFRPEVVVGDVAPEALTGWPLGGARIVGPPAGWPDAARLITLVGLGAARQVIDLSAWEPNYGRPAEAQAKWERQHGRAVSDSGR